MHARAQAERPHRTEQEGVEFRLPFAIAPVADPDQIALAGLVVERTESPHVGGLVPGPGAATPAAALVELAQDLAEGQHAVVVFERVGRRRCPIINISGGTEIAGSFLFPLPIQSLKPCTLGGPAPGMATEVVDENGAPVRGRKGYLVCTAPSPSMTRGIWGDPKRYLDTYWSRFPGMWYHGDWASVDEDGHWFVHGRADESMNVAGRKVQPEEVEQVLRLMPGVAEVRVLAAPDARRGQQIVACIVADVGDHTVGALAVRRFCARRLAPHKIPRTILMLDAMPLTVRGKTDRAALEELGGIGSGGVSRICPALLSSQAEDAPEQPSKRIRP